MLSLIENKLKCMIILVLTIPVRNQKLEIPPKSAVAPSVLKLFFNRSTFPSIPFIVIISFSEEYVNVRELSVVVENLNEISTKSLVITDEQHFGVLEDRCHIIIIYNHNQLDKLLKIFNKIDDTTLSIRRLFIWFSTDISDNERTFILDHGQISNINEIIIVNHISRLTEATDIVDVEKVSVTLENLVLREKKPEVKNGLTYVASRLNVDHVMQEINNTLYNYVSEMNSIPIQVTSFIRPLSVERHQLKSLKTVYIGADIMYLKALAWQLNMSYNLTVGEITQFGTVYKNGTFTKTLQDILDNKIDIGINRYVPTDDSLSSAFIIPVDREKLCFVLRKPQSKIRNWSVFLAFQFPVWICIAAVHSFVYSFFSYWKTPHWSLITFVQTTVSARHFRIPMAWEGQRIMYIFWLGFNIVINNSFITVFVVQLLRANKAEQFKTLTELFEANTTLLTEVGHFKFRHSLLKKVRMIKFYGKPEMISANTALLASQLTRMKLLKMFPSEFYVVPECITTTFSGPLVSPSSAIFQKIITVTSRLHSAGFFEVWVRNHLLLHVSTVRGDLEPYLDQDIVNPLKLLEFAYLLKYWAFGLALASYVFICELLLNNYM